MTRKTTCDWERLGRYTQIYENRFLHEHEGMAHILQGSNKSFVPVHPPHDRSSWCSKSAVSRKTNHNSAVVAGNRSLPSFPINPALQGGRYQAQDADNNRDEQGSQRQSKG